MEIGGWDLTGQRCCTLTCNGFKSQASIRLGCITGFGSFFAFCVSPPHLKGSVCREWQASECLTCLRVPLFIPGLRLREMDFKELVAGVDFRKVEGWRPRMCHLFRHRTFIKVSNRSCTCVRISTRSCVGVSSSVRSCRVLFVLLDMNNDDAVLNVS